MFIVYDTFTKVLEYTFIQIIYNQGHAVSDFATNRVIAIL